MRFTYKGLTEKLTRHIVTGEEVERQLQRMLQENPRIAEVTDRPTQSGDEVILDYAGFCDGVQFPGGTGENQTLVLGSGMFIPGFEEQLLDKEVGEEVTVQVTFPKEYHAADLAGKPAEFRCVIHKIRVKTPYQLDDTFAKEVGGCDTLEEMRERMRSSLQSYTDERGEMDLQDRLLQRAAYTLDVSFTEEQIEEAVKEQIKAFEAQLAKQGLNMQMYCSFMNLTEQQVFEDMRPTAETALKSQAAIDKIVEMEGLTASEEEMGQAIALVARQNGMTVEQLKPYFTEQFHNAIKNSVLTGKVMALIREHATVTVE